MDRPHRRRTVTSVLVAVQVFLLVASLFAAVPVAAEDPSADPGASSPPATEPSAEPSAEPSPEPSPKPSAEPNLGPTADPTAEPTAELPAEPPAEPTPAPDPTAAPTSTATAEPAPAAPPTITSDKADYAPGELVTLSGTGWQPGEAVHIFVNDDIGNTWYRYADATADATGAIADSFNLPDWFVAVYRVVATGDVSGTVTTTFTDSQPQGNGVSVTNTSVTVEQGVTADFGSVTVKKAGSNTTCTLTLSVSSGLPSGAAAVFGTNPLTMTTADVSSTFTVTTTPATPVAASTLTVSVSRGSDCQGSGTETATVTLIVTTATATTTTAAPASATFGDASVSLNASVTAASGPAVGVGSVTFTIKDGATTIGSVSDNTITAGSASASFPLAGVSAGTYTIQAAYSGGPGLQASNNSTQPPPNLTVAKAATTTTVTCSAGPFSYTGSALTPCSASVTGPNGLNQVLTVSYLNNVNAGTATASATYVESTNYLGSGDIETFAIGKAATVTTVTCTAGPFSYTGSAQTPCSATVIGPGGLNQALTVTYGNNVNAGPATAGATYAESANYLGSSDGETFTIDQAPTVTTVLCSAGPFGYDGTAKTPCVASVTGPGGLDESLTVTYADNVDAGTATASAAYLETANYLGSSGDETFTIDKAATVTTVTCTAGPFTYDGAAHEPCSATVTGPGGLNESLTVSYVDNVNAGTATASAAYAESANYSGSSASETFVIDKAATTTTVTCGSGPFVYDGAAHEPCSASVAGPAGLDEPVTVTYANNVDAGTATASATYAESANYLGSSDDETFTIDKAPTVTTVTCTAGPFVYSGAAHEPCSASVTGPGGLDETLTVTYGNNVDAGTATASATYVESANYLGSSDDETFTIDKAPTNTSVECDPGPFVYDGAPHEPCSASVTGPSGLNEALTVTYLNNVNAGPATASAAFAETANYLGSSDDETFTIDKAPTVTTVECDPGPFVYNGVAHEPCSATVTGPAGLDEPVTVTYADNVNAGTATASAAYLESANYLGSSDDETFTIDKAPTVTTVNCTAGPFVYNGAAHEPCGATVTGPGGLNQILTVTYASNVNAGTATANAAYGDTANYLGSSDDETFTIDKAPTVTTVTCDPGPFTYNGSAHEPCSAAVTGPAGLDVSLTVTYADNVNAGPATASATYAESANYLGSSDITTFTIDKADPTCHVSGFTGPYDGLAHGATGTCTGVGGVADVLAGLSLGLSFIDVPGGTANWVFTDVTGNYENESGSVGITIDKGPTLTTVTCTAGLFTYNGAAHMPCSATVTGPAGLNESLTVTYVNNVNAGTATASAAYVESANYLGSLGSASFTIAKADPTCTVSGYSGVFDSLAHGATGTCTGIGGVADVLAGLSLGSSFTAVPGGTANWTFTDVTNNYLNESGSVTIVILPWNAAGHGFYQPVGVPNSVFVAAPGQPPAPTATTIWNAAKSGSTIPLKFNVFAGPVEQTNLNAVSSFVSMNLACASGADIEDVDFVTTGATTLRYEGGQFIQNWKTPKLGSDSCFRTSVVFADGSSISAFFKLKR